MLSPDYAVKPVNIANRGDDLNGTVLHTIEHCELSCPKEAAKT